MKTYTTKMVELREYAKGKADTIVLVDDSTVIPNILGRLVRATLKEYGWYAAVVDGKRVFYEKKAEYETR